jgi:hypothetical protein
VAGYLGLRFGRRANRWFVERDGEEVEFSKESHFQFLKGLATKVGDCEPGALRSYGHIEANYNIYFLGTRRNGNIKAYCQNLKNLIEKSDLEPRLHVALENHRGMGYSLKDTSDA